MPETSMRRMTTEKLEQYRALVAEVEVLETRQRKTAAKKPDIVTDTVRGSSPYFPYTSHTISITGEDTRHNATLLRIERARNVRIKKAHKLLAEIEEFIATLEDAKLRRIIEVHYIDGKTWRQTATIVYGSPQYEDAARKRVKRFLQKD